MSASLKSTDLGTDFSEISKYSLILIFIIVSLLNFLPPFLLIQIKNKKKNLIRILMDYANSQRV